MVFRRNFGSIYPSSQDKGTIKVLVVLAFAGTIKVLSPRRSCVRNEDFNSTLGLRR